MGSARNASSCAAIIGIPSLFFSSAYSCRHSHGSFHRATVLAREGGLLVVQRFGGLPPHQSCKREWPPRGHHCVRVQGEACFFGFQLFISALDELCSSMNSLPATLTTPKNCSGGATEVGRLGQAESIKGKEPAIPVRKLAVMWCDDMSL